MRFLISVLVVIYSINAFADVNNAFQGIISCVPAGSEKNEPIVFSVDSDGLTTVHREDFKLQYEATFKTKQATFFIFKGVTKYKQFSIVIPHANTENSSIISVREMPVRKMVGKNISIDPEFESIVFLRPNTTEAECGYTASK
jgi:hypothetical protein